MIRSEQLDVRSTKATSQSIALLTTFVCLIGSVWLCGSSLGDDFKQPLNNEQDTLATPMPAEISALSFKLPAGIKANVFAAEPDVQNPIAMTWDSQGRLWVAENYTYSDRSQRLDLSLRDRIVIFSDEDGDGRHDQRKVFTDQLQVLTSIEVGRGGVWALCPPQLLFIPDADGDGTPDGLARVVLDGFDVAKDSYHNFANGLKWGPDGWLYGRCGGSCPGRVGQPGSTDDERTPLEGGIWRLHLQSRRFEVLVHGTTNPWGHDWDEWGECFFINTVNGHLWHLIQGAHFKRPFTLDPNPQVFEPIDTHADHWHFDTGVKWFQSRGGVAHEYGGGHAHVGMMIYQADNWPAETRGRLFTWNIHGQRANQEILQRLGSGYVGRHGRDILFAADPFFRGMELSYGPDGAVYAIDWSDTGECHESTGVHRSSGRIFRFAADKPRLTTKDVTKTFGQAHGDLLRLSNHQLVQLLAHSNQWYVRQARLILSQRSQSEQAVESSDAGTQTGESLAAVTRQLEQQVHGLDDRLAYQSLMTLHAMNGCYADLVMNLLNHSNEHLRVWAIRLLMEQYLIDDIFGRCSDRRALPVDILERLIALARGDESGLVRLALASAVQRLPLENRCEIAQALMSRSQDADDHNLPLLVWYGLIPVAEALPMQAAELTADSLWPKTVRLIARRLASLFEQCPQALERLVSVAKEQSASGQQELSRLSILQGISDGLNGQRRVPQPGGWQALVEAVKNQPARDDPQAAAITAVINELSILFGDGRTLEEARSTVLDDKADAELRMTALSALVRSQPEDLVDICLPLLKDARLNTVAAQGLASSDDSRVARELIKQYFRFRAPRRPQVISILVSRPGFAEQLLAAIANEKIPASDLTAFDVRQIRSHGNAQLDQIVSEVWGEYRETDHEKWLRADELKRLATAQDQPPSDPSRGRRLFLQQCGNCHRLFGDGEQIGPDLTGTNRQNLDYWLENIVDPSAVVGKQYTMSVVLLRDGRVLNGLIVRLDQQSMQLQTATQLLTLAIGEIEQVKSTALSPMPDGLLDNLSDLQIRDIFDYLRQPTQVPLPVE